MLEHHGNANIRACVANASSKTPPLPTPRQAAFLFLRRPEKLRVEEQETLVKLRQIDPEVDLAYDLLEQFTQMLRNRTGELLDAWLAQVESSQLPELQSFAAGIEKDKEAVRAGLNGRDQQWRGRRSCDQTQTHQKAGIWAGRIPLAAQACPSRRVDGDPSARSLLTFQA
jgi:Transposase